MRTFVSYWLPVIIYCLLIFIQSERACPGNIPNIPYMDKVIHFVMYAILGSLLLRAFQTTHITKKKIIILSITVSFFYGVGDEIHQYFVPYRNADIMDALADLLGSIIGVLMYNTIKKR